MKDYLVEQKGYAATNFGKGTLNNILNRCGYTLKRVRKSLPFRRMAQTDAIFENIAWSRATDRKTTKMKLSDRYRGENIGETMDLEIC